MIQTTFDDLLRQAPRDSAYDRLMTAKEERWRPVVGFEGLYEVSDLGRIRNQKGKIKTPQSAYGKYLSVCLWKNNRVSSAYIHRMVMAAFTAPSELQVNHIDGNKLNNRLENLEWATIAQNMQHSIRVLGNNKRFCAGFRGCENGFSRPVYRIGSDGTKVRFECIRDAVASGNFTSPGISAACTGTQATHRGYRWEYAGPRRGGARRASVGYRYEEAA